VVTLTLLILLTLLTLLTLPTLLTLLLNTLVNLAPVNLAPYSAYMPKTLCSTQWLQTWSDVVRCSPMWSDAVFSHTPLPYTSHAFTISTLSFTSTMRRQKNKKINSNIRHTTVLSNKHKNQYTKTARICVLCCIATYNYCLLQHIFT